MGRDHITIYNGESKEAAERRQQELLDAIARKNGVDPEKLRPIFDHLGLRGLSTDDLVRLAEEAVAALLEQARKITERSEGNEDIAVAIIAARKKLQELDSASAISGLQTRINEEDAARRARIVPLLREKADIELKIYDYQGARKTLEQLISSASDDVQAWADLADACLAAYDPQEASNALEHARMLARRQVDSCPDDSNARRNLARLSVKLGNALIRTEVRKGMDVFEDGLKIIEPVIFTNEDDTNAQSILAELHEGIGIIWATFGNWDSALGSFDHESRAINRLIHLEPNNPAWQRGLARVTRRQADYLAQSDLDQFALSGYERYIQILEQVQKADPNNGEDQDSLAWGHRRVGDMLAKRGDREGALASIRAGIEVAERLNRATQEVVNWQQNLSNLYTKLGAILEWAGDLDGSIASYQKALGVAERILPLWPRNPQFLRDVVMLHEGIGDVLGKRPDYSSAAAAYQSGAALAENYLKVDVGIEQGVWMDELQTMQGKLGGALISNGDKSSGLVALRRSLEVSEMIAQKHPHQAMWLKNVIYGNLQLAKAGDAATERWQAIINNAETMRNANELTDQQSNIIQLAERRLQQLGER